MKKFTKVFLFTALGLAVTGTVLIGAGIASGASLNDFHEGAAKSGNGFFRLRWLERLDDRLEHFGERMEYHMERWADDDWEEEDWDHDDWKDDSRRLEDGHVSTQAFSASQVELMTVETYGGKVEIKKITGDEIQISNLTAMDTIQFEAEDRELYIYRQEVDENQKPLVIEVPENKRFQELDLQSIASNIMVEGKIQAEETTLYTEAGKLEVELLDSRETDMECYAGNLEVRHTGKLDDYGLELESDACKIELDGKSYSGFQEGIFGTMNSTRTIDVEANAGNLEISFEGKQE